MASFAFSMTRWALRLASRLTKADVRVHNLQYIEPDMAIIYAVNHFTRLETFLLPYELNKHAGQEVWSLAAGELFTGRIGNYLRKLGTVSTRDPDRDKVIVHSLLRGDHPWIIFPEGQMIKDKKVIDPAGVFSVYNRGTRRPPHRGVATLALRAEFSRRKLARIQKEGGPGRLAKALEIFDLETLDDVLAKRTVIIPVNITYFPVRARDNAILRMASAMAKELSDRALEELSVEGTLLSGDTDIDITLGRPIDVSEYLDGPEARRFIQDGDDLETLHRNPRSLFSTEAQQLMNRYMTDIYALTRVNYDHIFATLVRYQGPRPFTERQYRNRIFLCAHEIVNAEKLNVHSLLTKTYRDIIYEDPSRKFHDFMQLCLKEGIIAKEDGTYHRVLDVERGKTDFHQIRTQETTYVIANEAEPLEGFVDTVQRIVRLDRNELSERVRSIFVAEETCLFAKDYARFATAESHPPEVGQPFLLVPDRIRGGIVLSHGYLAAPKEIRALAEFLYELGYLVYGVRLRGHGTSPEDLQQASWQDWYESFNRGYVIVKSYTDNIILGGFSTGGTLALLAAGRKRDKVESVFAINAPQKLKQFSARFVPGVVSMNSLLQRFRGNASGWEYVENSPENEHINYDRNPLRGVRELGRAMDQMEHELPNIVAPALLIQGSRDPVVSPASGLQIFTRVGTPLKELIMMERDKHGIVNGPGSGDVFDRVYQFLLWGQKHSPRREVPEPAVTAALEGAGAAPDAVMPGVQAGGTILR